MGLGRRSGEGQVYLGLRSKSYILSWRGGMGRGAREATGGLGGAWGATASSGQCAVSSTAPAGMRSDSVRPDLRTLRGLSTPLRQPLSPSSPTRAHPACLFPSGQGDGRAAG